MRRRLSILAAHYGCVFSEGRVSREVPNEQLPLGVAVVANASRSVADVSLEARRHVEREFAERVTDSLRGIVGQRLRTQEKVTGKSGRVYRVDNVILDSQQKDRIAFIESVRTRAMVSGRFMEFHDLSHTFASILCYSVTGGDESLTGSDEALLKVVSELVPFAETRRRFLHI